MARIRRSETMNPLERGAFHITARVVGKAHRFGRIENANLIRRREFIVNRIATLAGAFGISVAFVAIMANHLHIVLLNLPELAAEWSDQDVIKRACRIFPYKFRRMGVKDLNPTAKQLARFTGDQQLVAEMRRRLSDPSWFMKQLLQSIATKLNKDDGAQGHVFEARFHHRVIASEIALFLCAVYVDLNQIAAFEADRLEDSRFTSIGARMTAHHLRLQGKLEEATRYDGYLQPISTRERPPNRQGGENMRRAVDDGLFEIPVEKYFELLDQIGRTHRDGKGSISDELPPVLERLGLTAESLCDVVENYATRFKNVVGTADELQKFSADHGGIWKRHINELRDAENQTTKQ